MVQDLRRNEEIPNILKVGNSTVLALILTSKNQNFISLEFSLLSQLDENQRHRWKAYTFPVKMMGMILMTVENCGFQADRSVVVFVLMQRK